MTELTLKKSMASDYRNLSSFRDEFIVYLRESKKISPLEERQIGDDLLSKPRQAAAYLNFFNRNVDPDIKGKKILEFGSGQGICALEFSKAGAEVTGVDIDETLINMTRRLASENGLNTKFLSYSGARLPLDDNYFDYSYCLQTFEHLDDPAHCLSEIHRVLKRGGILHISFPNRLYPYDAHAQLFLIPWLPRGLADFALKRCRKHDLKYYSNLHFYSYWGFKKMLSSSTGKFSILMKNESQDPIKNMLINILHKFNIQRTILTENISVFLKKC